MKKPLLFILVTVLLSCKSDDISDCSLVDCLYGDVVELVFLRNGQNIFESNPPTVFTVSQNELPLEFVPAPNYVFLLTIEDTNNPIQINIDDTLLNLEITSTPKQGECCSSFIIDSLEINGVEICSNSEFCDENLEVNLD